jgi:ParB-like chromosome segregation protein Spo0J
MEASDRALKNAAAERAPSFVGAYISLLAINVLEQPRQTFEEIATLAQSIADRKLLFPPIVAQLERDQAQEYIEMVNGIWDTNHGIADLSPAINKDGQEVFFILLDGERRYRACMYLVNVGCEDHGAPCYDKHFDDGDVEVRLAIGINADDASKYS